jgi:hypothetical protein
VRGSEGKRLSDSQFNYAYLKVDETGQLIDIRTVTKARLSGLIDYYEGLSKRARSAQMKDLYAGIREDLVKFRDSGLVPRVDALSWAKAVRIENVRHLMNSYWDGEPFANDSGIENRLFFQNILNRKTEYVRPRMPSDEVIRHLYRVAVEDRDINGILRELARSYGVTPPTVAEAERSFDEFDDYLATYDPASKTLLWRSKLKTDGINALFIIGSCFFQHLSNLMNWRFADEILSHQELERREADAFAESILDKLVLLGCLAKRQTGRKKE